MCNLSWTPPLLEDNSTNNPVCNTQVWVLTVSEEELTYMRGHTCRSCRLRTIHRWWRWTWARWHTPPPTPSWHRAWRCHPPPRHDRPWNLANIANTRYKTRQQWQDNKDKTKLFSTKKRRIWITFVSVTKILLILLKQLNNYISMNLLHSWQLKLYTL